MGQSTVKIRNRHQLEQMARQGRLSSHSTAALRAAFSQSSASRHSRKAPPAKKPRSPGEEAVAQVLFARFGCWEDGGEVVRELVPDPRRRYRLDFALPRWRMAVEIEGWRNHGYDLAAHHRDCQRTLFLSARDWLPFRLSHAQALGEGADVLEALEQAMALRAPTPREQLHLEKRESNKSTWWVLHQPG